MITTPSGLGAGRISENWKELARHADAPCERCLPLVQTVRHTSVPPLQLLEACCAPGQTLAARWLSAVNALVEHQTSRHRP